MKTLLVAPLGLSPGSLATAVATQLPDALLVIGSEQSLLKLPEIKENCLLVPDTDKVISFTLSNPFSGFTEGRKLAKKVVDRICKEFFYKEWNYVVCLTGGTTALQDCVSAISQLLPTIPKEIAVIDKRSVDEQRKNPYVIGEFVEIPRIEDLF